MIELYYYVLSYMCTGWIVTWLYIEFVRDTRLEQDLRDGYRIYPYQKRQLLNTVTFFLTFIFSLFWPIILLGILVRTK